MSVVLVVGSGGREHALAYQLSRSKKVSKVIVAPGNDGFDPDWERWACDLSKGRSEFVSLARRAREAQVALAVIGPDNPLADGIVDVFEGLGVLTFGPSAAAARLEASKAFAKEVMQAAGVPTARHAVVRTVAEAEAFWDREGWGRGWVVKADGLALGKGVRVCDSRVEAKQACVDLLPVSGALVIEERLIGEEISWLAFCDGERAAPLEPARDHKRLQEGDRGPNTGGMGAYSPVPGVPAAWEERVKREVFEPVLREMRERKTPFKGVLYAGLMVDFDADRFGVLEFNARFGDPETQALLPRLEDDLYDWCEGVARGDISKLGPRVRFKKDASVFVVAAARGYPDHPEKGAEIRFKKDLRAPAVFFAGVKSADGVLVTSGGRVLGTLGLAPTLRAARDQAYARMGELSFDGMHLRGDIARDA